MKHKRKKLTLPWMLLAAAALLIYIIIGQTAPQRSDSVENVPAFAGEPYVIINDNQPAFLPDELVTDSYEYYSPMDVMGRCGYAMACIGQDIMPTEDRGSIGQVKPSGWQLSKYDFVDGKYLYNRCHLIGYQLTGENANEANLITGTRYMNVEGMLPFENLVADYVKETGNHVLYRVTPIFLGNNLVASGVQMEAFSVEDTGTGICFHVYVYNNQPGVEINYRDGRNWISEEKPSTEPTQIPCVYILNTKSLKFHTEACEQAKSIADENRRESDQNRESLINQGYQPAGCCKP